MPDESDDFFGELEPQTVRRARVKNTLDCPILFRDDDPNLNVLVAEYFSEKQLNYISALFHSNGARINLVYVFSVVLDDKKKITMKMAQFFAENVRADLCEWLEPHVPIVTIGRAIYATTYDPDVQIQGFYDSVFNNTFFYSPFVNNRVYPIDTIFRICAFGQTDQKTREPIDYWDRWETHFAKDQIRRAVEAGNCSLPRKRSIRWVEVDTPNAWLQEHIDAVPEQERWAAVDSETGGLNKLSDPIGEVTLSFDGWTAYHLDWKKINPRILTAFLQKHNCVYANGKYDVLCFMFHGCDLLPIAWDTMIAGHLLNEMRSNSLKTHAFHYTNYGGYDLELEKFKWKYPGLQNYLQIPDAIRIPYACYDAAITYQVWQAEVRAMKKEPALWEYYHTYCLPMLKVFIKAEYKGFCIDWGKVSEVGETIQEKIKESLEAVRAAFHKPDLNPNKKQELGRFIESLGWPCINRTKAGGFKVSKREFAEWEKQGHTEVKTLIEYSKWMIIWNTFIGADSSDEDAEDEGDSDDPAFDAAEVESFAGDDFFSGVDRKAVHHDATGLWQYRGVDDRIHTTFHPFMTHSHRHRCVAKGTKILVNGGYSGDPVGIPIEDIKVGDYVFCYDDNLKPALKRVTWAGKTGHKEVIRLHFIGSHNRRGYLDVTPEHKVRLSDGSYCEAQYLAPGAKVLFMYPHEECAVAFGVHGILSIEYRGDVVDVYDLTVEDVHNFIANGICVSNSSSPNLQNLPKRNKDVSSIVRQCYVPPDIVPCKAEEASQIWVFDRLNGLSLHSLDDLVEIGFSERIKVPAKDLHRYDFREYGYRAEYYRKAEPGEYYIIEGDGQNLQARVAASMSHDKNLCDLFLHGGDFHTNNTYHILAKYQLFDECTITLDNGQVITEMEWSKAPAVTRKGKEPGEIYYKDIQKGDVIGDASVVSVTKVSRTISYEEFCANAKKGKNKSLRDVGKAIGLAFIFGASENNLAGGTLRMVWTPKMCTDFIRERGLEGLQAQITQGNKRLQGDDLLYFVVASFFRSEFFKLYPELENWIFECARTASADGYRRSPWGSRRLLPQLRTKGRHADSGMYKNLCNIAVNSPVQDYETAVMSTAMIKIDSMYEDLGYLSYIVGTVHDSVVGVIHRSELESCLRIALEAFNFEHPATYGIAYSGECNVADYTKGEFWGFGHREVEYDEVKDVPIIRKRYKRR